MFTMAFHFVHSATHIFHSQTRTHQIEEDAKLAHSDLSLGWNKKIDHAEWLTAASVEKCFVCDSFLSPFITTDEIHFDTLPYQVFAKVQTVKAQEYPSLNFIYFSLRAPPLSA